MKNNYFYLLLLVITFISTLFITKSIIPKLSKSAKQPIYTDGPDWHIKKSGTPTMGGIGFIIPSVALMVIISFSALANENYDPGLSLLISSTFCLFNSFIGVWDDLIKILHSQNAGLTPRQKLFFQTALAIGYLSARNILTNEDTVITFGGISINLGVMYYPLAIIFILGIVNCANLTDGVDGLASSVSFAISISSFLFSLGRNSTVSIISAIGVGATLGFLAFNIHPAKIFMGDTGSLFLGALCVCYAFSLNSLPAYTLVGGVYVIEGLSVIMQVAFFKLTGKRILKMAPLHHHFEKCGYDENKICIYAMLTTFALSIIAFTMLGGIK